MIFIWELKKPNLREVKQPAKVDTAFMQWSHIYILSCFQSVPSPGARNIELV